MDWHASLGLALIIVVILIVRYLPVQEKCTPADSHKFRQKPPKPLANRKPGLVKCSVAKPYVPIYRRSDVLRVRAQNLATSVAVGKRVIAAHRDTGLEVCSPTVRTVIAGVVRDRRELKELEYDQPF